MLSPAPEGGALLTVRVTPRGGRDAVDGPGVDAAGRAHLRVRVAAAPEDGAATEAARRLIAKTLGLPPSSVALRRGATQRLKTFHLALTPEATAERLAPLQR